VLGILFLSELIPKTVGAIYWRRLWRWIVWPLIFLRAALQPVIWVIMRFTDLLTGGRPPPVVTEEEILAMVKIGASEGHLTEEEGDMVRNIINLENRSAKDIMTPRVVAFTLDADSPVGEAIETLSTVSFSRIPVYQGHPESVVGYVLRRHLVGSNPEDRARPLQSLAKPISFFPETANCLTLLNQFLKHRLHIAMVTDEYGGVAGLVTLEDLIETLLGYEIVDETDHVIDMQSVARMRSKPNTGHISPPGSEPSSA
jgi:CBS domain containing-hemolysin-like protein